LPKEERGKINKERSMRGGQPRGSQKSEFQERSGKRKKGRTSNPTETETVFGEGVLHEFGEVRGLQSFANEGELPGA